MTVSLKLNRFDDCVAAAVAGVVDAFGDGVRAEGEGEEDQRHSEPMLIASRGVMQPIQKCIRPYSIQSNYICFARRCNRRTDLQPNVYNYFCSMRFA